jgi:hypothetical protein
VSDGLLMNLAAIENSDHMTSPHADKYDFDGWYRAHITELIKVVREQHAELHDLQQSRTLEFKLVAEEKIRLQQVRITELEDALRPFADAGFASIDNGQTWQVNIPIEDWKNAARVLANESPSSTNTSDGSPVSTESTAGES